MKKTNLIGVSGKAGSGKDTVGSIIQYLTSTDASDKTLGFIKLGYDIKGYHNSTFEIKKFAGKLKAIASLLSGAKVEDFEDQEFKKGRMTADWGMTYREFLQKLGTDAMRDGLHEEVWVNALFADYKAIERVPEKRMSIMPNWCITDMRFPNEMEAIKERGGITIRVTRDLVIGAEDYGYTKVSVNQAEKDGILIPQHPSETALDDAEFDYYINNEGTVEDLIEKVKTILIKEGIL